ncbi:hypothetical protein RJT34_08213 [Clitoria ternatea]|uniref:Uncharacterized protein n=1 Tax=Clitoria ternatea TaxID=43366 RepID=A0AAN9PVJ2_CLITE
MAVTETNTKFSLHTRCNSLPSAPHPVVSQYEDHLRRLKDREVATCSISSSSLTHKLDGLLDLHDCTDKLLQLPMKQQALARECSDKRVNGTLEGSLRILDICDAAKDFLLTSKESMHELHSAIRRRRAFETVAISKYLVSRKNLKKAIRKALANLKTIKGEFEVSSLSNKDNDTLSILGILKEAEEITMRSLESVLLFMCGPNGQSKKSKWSAISKLMQPKRVACDSQEDPDTNEFEKVDAALHSLLTHKSSSIENIQCHMENLEMCIQDLEVALEHLSRKLIRNRGSLLNIFNH